MRAHSSQSRLAAIVRYQHFCNGKHKKIFAHRVTKDYVSRVFVFSLLSFHLFLLFPFVRSIAMMWWLIKSNCAKHTMTLLLHPSVRPIICGIRVRDVCQLCPIRGHYYYYYFCARWMKKNLICLLCVCHRPRSSSSYDFIALHSLLSSSFGR